MAARPMTVCTSGPSNRVVLELVQQHLVRILRSLSASLLLLILDFFKYVHLAA
jgi:hypothetical protein